jgi:hypothetical protein
LFVFVVYWVITYYSDCGCDTAPDCGTCEDIDDETGRDCTTGELEDRRGRGLKGGSFGRNKGPRGTNGNIHFCKSIPQEHWDDVEKSRLLWLPEAEAAQQ